ncbi:MAG: hypothetical protein LBL57_03015 [Tannerella sp.]|nr:hypothetical protein [Tannerella sp.]
MKRPLREDRGFMIQKHVFLAKFIFQRVGTRGDRGPLSKIYSVSIAR